MKVLVGCERFGVVRDAFRKRGHIAWSCDLVDASGKHYKGNVLDLLTLPWDLAIFHPPCTYLASSGLHWNKRPGYEWRAALTEESLEFVRLLLNCNIPRIALENPIGRINTAIRKPDQIIQPWMFGHPESKSTCLWLKGLPVLQPTNVLSLPERGYWDNQTPSRQNKLTPGPERAMLRSRTYQGIADAMVEQWGTLMDKEKS